MFFHPRSHISFTSTLVVRIMLTVMQNSVGCTWFIFHAYFYIFAENIPVRTTPKISTHAIERPHATISMLQRQGSFRGLSHLNHASPFKRQLSLRISDLPSNLERTRSHNVDFKLDQKKQNSQFLNLKTPGEWTFIPALLVCTWKYVLRMFINRSNLSMILLELFSESNTRSISYTQPWQ